MGIKTYQEKNTNQMKKTRAQSGLPVKRKTQKTIQKYGFKKKCHFGCFLGFFFQLVSLIELKFFSFLPGVSDKHSVGRSPVCGVQEDNKHISGH